MSPSDSQDRGRVLPGYTNVELVERLRACRCTGPLWSLASAGLADYGVKSLHAMIKQESINAKLAALLHTAFSICPAELWDADEWVGLAAAQGLDKFRRDTIADQGWKPQPRPGEKHADLPTWVVNGMLLQIPDILRSERRRAARDVHETPCPPETLNRLAERPDELDDPVDLVISEDGRRRLKELLESMPDDLAAVIRMQAETGLSRAECCRRLGLRPHAIEEKLRRWRHRHPDPGEQT